MKESRKGVVISLVIIALGSSWLLNPLEVIPGVDWVWTVGLGISGLLVMTLGGLNKLTFVMGSFLIVSSVLSVLRQTGRLRVDLEMPILFILVGFVLLLANLFRLRTPGVLRREEEDEAHGSHPGAGQKPLQ